MNTMTVDDFQASIELDPDLDLFRGKILGFNRGAGFYSKSVNVLAQQALRVCVASCVGGGTQTCLR